MICGLTRPGSVVSWCIHGRDRIGTGRDRYGSPPHGDGDRRAAGCPTTYSSRLDLSGALAVALSQSGQTEEIVETLAWARDCGARTLAISWLPALELAPTGSAAAGLPGNVPVRCQARGCPSGSRRSVRPDRPGLARTQTGSHGMRR